MREMRIEIRYFYPRSPRGERQREARRGLPCFKFLSTLPARGATIQRRIKPWMSFYFYPRSPRGERRALFSQTHTRADQISIHAPREGSDVLHCRRSLCTCCNFYPRSPRGERQQPVIHQHLGRHISIHAPREGSDPCRYRPACPPFRHFYPRSPRGERRCIPNCGSTSISISIHAPREGSDTPCSGSWAPLC